jgi:hypothetical protein
MADEKRSQNDRAVGDENAQDNRRDQNQNRQAGSSNQNGAQDDVAEDRNLSGSSTWLTLPDQQPADDDRSENS